MLQPFAPRLQPFAARLPPYAPRLPPSAPRLPTLCTQLLYRLSDGSYEAIRYGRDEGETQDPRDSAVGRLYTQYGAYFVVARDAFGFGVVSLLCATVVKTCGHCRPYPSPFA